MKPQQIRTAEMPNGNVRVEALFAAEDVKRVYSMARRILAFSNQIDSTSDQDLPGLLLEKLGTEALERQYEEGVPSLLAPWVVDALDFPTILDPLLIDAQPPVYGAPYSFTIEVTPRPSYELSSYEPVTVELPGQSMSEEELNGYMVEIALDFSPFAEVEERRGVQAGDRVTLDITTFRGMKPVPYLTSKERDFYIGEGWFSQEFDDQVMGLKVGERKTFDFQALGEESKDANDTQTLTTTVAVRKICTQTLPEMTDEWVSAHIPGVSNLAEFQDMVRDQVVRDRADADAQELLKPVAQALAARLDASIPDAVLQQAANDVIRQVDQQAASRDMELVEYLESQGLTLEAFGEGLMAEARQNVLEGYALDACFRHFGLTLTDADIDAAALQMAGGRPFAADSLRQQFEQGGRSYILREAASRLKANREAAARAVVRRV